MIITVPELALVLLVGPSGAGKSTFARKHFQPTEIVSSDRCRAMVADDENDQSVTPDAFDIVHLIAAKRMKAGHLTVIDATNVQAEARRPLLKLAKQFYLPTVAIVLDMPLGVCLRRNVRRRDRTLEADIIRNQRGLLKNSLTGLVKEGFRQIYVLNRPEDLDGLQIVRKPNRTNQKSEAGPFDLIGDVHGCFGELLELLTSLGYRVSAIGEEFEVYHPEGRKLVFLGDLVDRGPDTPQVLRLVMAAAKSGDAYCVSGNHDAKLAKALRGNAVNINHGLAESLAQLAGESAEFRLDAGEFLRTRPSHYVFDGGRLIAVHAGLREEMHGRDAGKVRVFCLYGETTGETDEFGLPVRYPWAADYRGKAMVIFGHTPVAEPEWLNNTLCIDTGCVFGGKLTAFRYPEGELVSVLAKAEYYRPTRPFIING